jgi:diaminopimelate decarboxylase
MTLLRGQSGQLELGGVDLAEVARDPSLGTPTYVYDLSAIAREALALHAAFAGEPHLIAYAVKANSAGAVVRALATAGCGADVVSLAELTLALACGIAPNEILFSGVAKLDHELDAAIGAGSGGIGAIQLESVEEIARVVARARLAGRKARVSLRLNPEAPHALTDTHAHIATGHDDAKFGIHKADVAEAIALVLAAPELSLAGLSTHVGSQFTATTAYLEAARALFTVASDVRQAGASSLRFVDTGGGFGIDYGTGCPVTPAEFVRQTQILKSALGLGDLAHYIEPGRALVAAHGVLLSSVVQHKVTPRGPAENVRRRWLMIDAGMNDLLRPALYQARHRVEVVAASDAARIPWQVVGPVCESADDFGVHELPAIPPTLLAILDAGAYGYSMASRYNGRALPAEVFVQDGRVIAARGRDDLSVWVNDRKP